jgi:4-hydroxy-3-methylbut-2-enyl diphosphate reductase
MIHNPHVNSDLRSRGVQFLMSPEGDSLISFDELQQDDVVIVPAFGTTVEMFEELEGRGIDPQLYNTTCPFVEKVWKRAAALGDKGYSVIIHGKHYHEETRATFSHARLSSPALVIRDLKEAHTLGEFIRGERDVTEFSTVFQGRFSENFDPVQHLSRFGVVNQTTMLANETQAIADLLKEFVEEKYGSEVLSEHFADTRDTLCYATQENQAATNRLIESGGDLALVVGGYNSSNTSHLVKLCQEKVPTFYIKDAQEMVSSDVIRHLNLSSMSVVETSGWLKDMRPLTILLTAGASCPDVFVDQVIVRVAEFCGVEGRIEGALAPFLSAVEEDGETGTTALPVLPS